MKITRNTRGFQQLVCPDANGETYPLVSQSSSVGDYEDSLARPGSSYLWIRDSHHLNREQVAELVEHLEAWLQTGRLDQRESQRETKREAWRVLRLKVPMAGTVLQFAVLKFGKYIPMGPWADNIDQLREDVEGMLDALELSVLDEDDVEVRP